MRPHTESKYSPRRILAVERQRQALELRMAGRSWDEIANALGYASHVGAIAAVEAALKRTLRQPADSYRALTLERLTKVLQTFWIPMTQQDEKAANIVLRTLKDIRELLGLDAPMRVDMSLIVRRMARELNMDEDEAIIEATRVLEVAKKAS